SHMKRVLSSSIRTKRRKARQMASISCEPNGCRTIQFMAADGKRKSIRLGKVPQKVADTIKVRVEWINSATITGCALDNDTAKWLTTISDDLHTKLAATGLAAARQTAMITVGQWLSRYRSQRAD